MNYPKGFSIYRGRRLNDKEIDSSIEEALGRKQEFQKETEQFHNLDIKVEIRKDNSIAIWQLKASKESQE